MGLSILKVAAGQFSQGRQNGCVYPGKHPNNQPQPDGHDNRHQSSAMTMPLLKAQQAFPTKTISAMGSVKSIP